MLAPKRACICYQHWFDLGILESDSVAIVPAVDVLVAKAVDRGWSRRSPVDCAVDDRAARAVSHVLGPAIETCALQRRAVPPCSGASADAFISLPYARPTSARPRSRCSLRAVSLSEVGRGRRPGTRRLLSDYGGGAKSAAHASHRRSAIITESLGRTACVAPRQTQCISALACAVVNFVPRENAAKVDASLAHRRATVV